jgi:hypothetical protein
VADKNKYDRRRYSNHEPEDPVDNTGYVHPEPDPQKPSIPKGSNRKEKEIPIKPDRDLITEQIRALSDAAEMELVEFTNLADQSIERGKTLLTRIDEAKKIITYDGINIELSPQNTKMLKNLIGKEVIDEEAAACLNKIANNNELSRARRNNGDDDSIPELDKNRQAIYDAFDDEVLEQNFPDFGLDLILLILYIVPKYMTIMLFTKLCSITTKIFNKGPKVVGINLGKKYLKPMFQKIWNKSANCTLELIYWSIGILIKKEFLKKLVTGKGSCGRALDGDYDVDVCGRTEDDLEIAITPFEMEQELLSLYFGLFPDQNPDLSDQRCNDGYEPSATERAMARNLIEAAMKEEVGAKSDAVEKDIKDASFKNTPFSSFTLLDRMQSDATALITSSEGVTKQLYTKDGDRIVDKVDANVLGFLSNMNGQLQRMDKTVTKIIALEFMDAQARQWLCCMVRLIYIILPRVSHMTGNDKIKPSLSPDDFEQFNIDAETFSEDARAWIKIIDTFLGILSGSTSINLEMSGLMSVGDIFSNALKMSLAEGLSILTTSLYTKLKQTMLDGIKGMRKYPDLAFAFEACPPFDWFMKMFECSIENFFAKIQGILAQMWAESANQMKDFDMAISITATNGSIKIFRDLFNILLEWDDALVNFCSLKKTATEAEKQEVLLRLENSLNPPDEKKINFVGQQIDKTAPVYSANIHLGPEEVNYTDDIINAHTDNGNPFYTQSLNTLNDIYYGEGPTEQELARQPFIEKMSPNVVHSVPNSTAWDPAQAVKSCGSEIMSILGDREKDIAEIHNALQDHWKVKTPPVDPGINPDFITEEDLTDEILKEISSEVNKYEES